MSATVYVVVTNSSFYYKGVFGSEQEAEDFIKEQGGNREAFEIWHQEVFI